MLCSFADREWSDRSGSKVIKHLKEVLDDPTEELRGSRKKDIWRLVKQLQCRKKLQHLRDSTGHILTDPSAITKEVTDFWAGIMNTGGGDEKAC